MNAHVPALVARGVSGLAHRRVLDRLRLSVRPGRRHRAPTEDMPPDPPGEYAQSCVGRERMFEYFSRRHGTPGRLFRLNYAIDMRYGVLHDIASKVLQRQADRRQPSAMSISSGRAMPRRRRCAASRIATRRPRRSMSAATKSCACATWPPSSAQRFGRDAAYRRQGAADRLADQHLAGGEAVRPAGRRYRALIAWTADWVARAMPSLGKPTKYEVRDGRY